MSKILLALSGGMDSATLLGHLLSLNHKVKCVGFSYGSKHNRYENASAYKIARHYKIEMKWIDLTEIMKSFKSDLLKSGGEIPEGHYTDKSMSATVVPFRNGIFLSVLAGFAESIGFSQVAVGIHQGDHAIYPDCRKAFFIAMDIAIMQGTDSQVSMVAPFINMNKTDILKTGRACKTPYELTRTCYKDQPVSCGKCGSCVERLTAFHKNNVEDPIKYEDREYYKKLLA